MIIPVILFALVSQPATAQALSLPIVDHLLDKLLPQDKSDHNTPAQANPTPPASQATSAQPDSAPTQQSALTTNNTSSGTAGSAPVIVPLEPSVPAPVEQPVALADSLNSTPKADAQDVLAERIENAAASSHQVGFLSPRICAQFFGACWYIAIPAGFTVMTGAYLLVTRGKYSLISLVSRLK